MTLSLRALQDELLAQLLADATQEQATVVAAGNDRLTSAEQVAIYREQIRERHRTSLRHDFAALTTLLGPSRFDALADAYLRQHPPTSYTLRDLGSRLPAVTASRLLALGLSPRLAALASDLARLEWAAIEASDASDALPLDLPSLTALSPAQLDASVLTFAPSLSLLALDHPVHTLTDALECGEPLFPAAPAPTFLAVSRRLDQSTAVTTLGRLEHAALVRLLAGQPLATALDAVAASLCPPDTLDDLTTSAGPWFSSWVQRGWLQTVTAPADDS